MTQAAIGQHACNHRCLIFWIGIGSSIAKDSLIIRDLLPVLIILEVELIENVSLNYHGD